MLGLYNQVGITSVCSGLGTNETLNLYKTLRDRGELTTRVYQNMYIPFSTKASEEEIFKALNELGYKTGDGDDWVKIGALKTIMDGGILTGTAFLREPWGERSKEIFGITDPGYRGVLNLTKDELVRIITIAAQLGWKFTAHVTGGGGVDTLLAAYREVNQKIPISHHRFSIIHGNFFTPQSMQIMKDLGVYADMQPAWFYKDADLINKVLGIDRIKTFHPYKSLFETGVMVNGGSDHMVKLDSYSSINPYNPFLAIWATITRTTERGSVIIPEEGLTREQALRMYTINNAWASFEENMKGSIEPGKYADLAVLSHDILTCPEEKIKDIKVLLTMVDGRIVYNTRSIK
jgi:predicted amidohydrolase YtcJ